MDHDTLVKTCKWIVQHHFGILATGTHQTVCAGCQDGTTWPCRPVLLARDIQVLELAK